MLRVFLETYDIFVIKSGSREAISDNGNIQKSMDTF